MREAPKKPQCWSLLNNMVETNEMRWFVHYMRMNDDGNQVTS